MRHDGEQPAALQPSALAPTAPNLSLTDFRARGRSLGMDNNYFDLQGGGPIIDSEFSDERCALRNLFGPAISPYFPANASGPPG